MLSLPNLYVQAGPYNVRTLYVHLLDVFWLAGYFLKPQTFEIQARYRMCLILKWKSMVKTKYEPNAAFLSKSDRLA